MHYWSTPLIHTILMKAMLVIYRQILETKVKFILYIAFISYTQRHTKTVPQSPVTGLQRASSHNSKAQNSIPIMFSQYIWQIYFSRFDRFMSGQCNDVFPIEPTCYMSTAVIYDSGQHGGSVVSTVTLQSWGPRFVVDQPQHMHGVCIFPPYLHGFFFQTPKTYW